MIEAEFVKFYSKIDLKSLRLRKRFTSEIAKIDFNSSQDNEIEKFKNSVKE